MKILETSRLLLRSINENDAEAIFEYSKNKNVGSNAGWKPHSCIEETSEIIKKYLNNESVFGIVLKENNKLFGSIGLIPDPKRSNNKTRMMGYAISEDYWGNGYTTEAAHSLIKFGFDELNIELISAYCYTFNKRSKRVLEKCGFEYEGTLHMAEKRYDETISDHDCYAIIRSKYKVFIKNL